jgi:hypothetical protein
MWFFIIQNVLISILVIFLAHHLILHLKDSYTVKKTKDLTESQSKKYKVILDEVYQINEKEKNELLQKLDETQSKVQQIEISQKQEVQVSEDVVKTDLSEVDFKQMNDDLDNFVLTQISNN